MIIKSDCNHHMRAEESSCVCPGCGAVCRGQFGACPDVWARGVQAHTPVAVAVPSPVVIRRDRAARARDGGTEPGPSGGDDQTAARQAPTPTPTRPSGRRKGVDTPRSSRGGVRPREKWFEAVDPDTPAPLPRAERGGPPASLQPQDVADNVSRLERWAAEIDGRAIAATEALDDERGRLERLATDLAARASEIDDAAEAHTRAFEHDRAWLERLAADLPARARQLDDRVAANLRAFDDQRASLEALARDLAARAEEIEARDAAHLLAVGVDQPSPEELRRLLTGMLPGVVADAVRLEIARRPERPAPPAPAPAENPSRAESNPVNEARQRSFDKRLDGLTRRTQEIDERVTTRLRAIDDDRAVLADVVRHQDRLSQAIADVDIDGRHEQLIQWITQVIPEAVTEAVDAALKVKAAAMSTAVGRVEKVRTEAKAMADNVRESSERMLEALFRRDQESAAQLQALTEERAAMTAMLEGGRDEIARSVVNNLPAMVEVAVRTAMERYATERRSGVQALAGRLKADSDVMRETLQRSFEKMMEALATREQALDDRAESHVKALEHERGIVSDLWDQAARTVTAALPTLVADAVKAADQLDRAELEATRSGMEELRAAHEAAAVRSREDHAAVTAELREAVAELRAALIDRDELIARQAAAYERVLDGLRVAMARKPVEPKATPTAEQEPALVATVVDEPGRGRARFGASAVPRAQRVERRMLKIDDRDDAAWPALGRREAALSDLLDADDH